MEKISVQYDGVFENSSFSMIFQGSWNDALVHFDESATTLIFDIDNQNIFGLDFSRDACSRGHHWWW